jgi:hypothetical protein
LKCTYTMRFSQNRVREADGNGVLEEVRKNSKYNDSTPSGFSGQNSSRISMRTLKAYSFGFLFRKSNLCFSLKIQEITKNGKNSKKWQKTAKMAQKLIFNK